MNMQVITSPAGAQEQLRLSLTEMQLLQNFRRMDGSAQRIYAEAMKREGMNARSLKMASLRLVTGGAA